MRPLVLLTGATGYVGSRLLPRLTNLEYRVRCFTRRELPPTQPYSSKLVEVFRGDLAEGIGVEEAMKGVHTAFFLVHSMAGGSDYAEKDRSAALHFAKAAEKANITRILYLGGLAHEDEPLSRHLRSRLEVGSLLRRSSVPTLEFRASIIIGARSLSFELLRALVERLPIMVTPRWVNSHAQPIALDDVLDYLMAALAMPFWESRVLEIGGPEVKSYGELMREYARIRGLKRMIVPIPVLTPALSALWLGLITPKYARVGRELIESLRCDTDVRDPSARTIFPIRPRSVSQAIREALEEESLESPNWRNWLREVRSARAA